MRLVTYITCIDLIAQVSLTWWSSYLFLDVLTLKRETAIIILPTDWLETILPVALQQKIKLPLPNAKNTLSKIAAPGTTSSGCFELVLLNKVERHISHLFIRSLNRAI